MAEKFTLSTGIEIDKDAVEEVIKHPGDNDQYLIFVRNAGNAPTRYFGNEDDAAALGVGKDRRQPSSATADADTTADAGTSSRVIAELASIHEEHGTRV